MTWHDPRTWIQQQYRRVYQPYVSSYIQRVSAGVSGTQRYVQRYKPIISYERAAERRRKLKEFVGVPARKARKVVRKELTDVQRLERQYIKKGVIKLVSPADIRPRDIGKVARAYTEKGFLRPTPQLEMQFVGSSEYRRQAEKVVALEAKHVKAGFYVGDYGAYQQEVGKLERLETTRAGRYKALTKEYSEYETAQKEYGRLHGLSVIGKYEAKEAEWGEHFKPYTSFIKESIAFSKSPEVRKLGEEGYGKYRRLFGLPSEPFKWEKKVARIESEYKRGIVEGISEKPLKTVVTTAAFFALPLALKAGGWGLKAARITPTIAKIPVVGKPVLKYTMPAIGVGLGGAYVAGTGYRIYETPPELRVREFGKITATELAPMGLGTYASYKYLPRVGGLITTLGKKKIPLTEIGVEKGYPVRRGIAETQLRESFLKSTLVQRPTGLHAAGRQVVAMEPIPQRAVLPGEISEGVYGWHAAPFLKKAGVREISVGTSELPMEYYAPIFEGYFAKVPKGIGGYKLFGMDMPRLGMPSAVRTHALGIRPIPKHLKGKARWEWIETEAKKGEFYMPLTKMEYEAGLPFGTQLSRGRLKYYTTVEGQRIPIYQYEVVDAGVAGKDITTVGRIATKYGEYYKPKPLFTPTELGVEYVGKRTVRYYGDKYGLKYALPKYEHPTYEKFYKEAIGEYGPYKKYKEPYYIKPKKPYYPEKEYKEPYYPKYKEPHYPKYEEPYYPPPEKPPHYPPKYPTYYPPSYPPIPVLIPPFLEDKKKPRKKKKLKHKEREWYERHYIPTVHELMRMPKGVGVMQPSMPELPEISIPKL